MFIKDTNGKTWLDKIAMVASETPGSSDYRPKCMTFQSGTLFRKKKKYLFFLLLSLRQYLTYIYI